MINPKDRFVLNTDHSSLIYKWPCESVSYLDSSAYKWDTRFLALAKEISTWSKDPSTKVGCVLVNTETHDVIGMGYNGFPTGIKDDDRLLDRNIKYDLILHAEDNAIMNAKNNTWDAVYTYPLPPCARCACKLIQASRSNLKTVITVMEPDKDIGWPERWIHSIDASFSVLKEAQVSIKVFNDYSTL